MRTPKNVSSSNLSPRVWLSAWLLASAACSGSGSSSGPSKPHIVDAVPVTASLTSAQQAEVDRLSALQQSFAGLTADQLLAKTTVPFRPQLGYDPMAAKNLPLIQASALKLGDAELAALGKNGFVISDKQHFPHFGYGYKTIYSQDLPVYVSADSILQAVHQSYDDILKAIETEALIPELRALLAGMRTRLGALAADAPAPARSASWSTGPRPPPAWLRFRCSGSTIARSIFRSSSRAATTPTTIRSATISAR
jgi:hypothetical protein